MNWSANIILRSSKSVFIKHITSIIKIGVSGQPETITDFSSFVLSSSLRLSFIGKENIVTLFSSDIEYIEFTIG